MGQEGGSSRQQRQARWPVLLPLGRQDGTAGLRLVTSAGGLQGDLSTGVISCGVNGDIVAMMIIFA